MDVGEGVGAGVGGSACGSSGCGKRKREHVREEQVTDRTPPLAEDREPPLAEEATLGSEHPARNALSPEPAPEEGGDPVCWAHLVCLECGAVIREGHRAGCQSAQDGPVPQ
ncbi:hypothetical protein [Trebonia sp.]|uniref:hypothetical protein n=1 Tax=Trebonia sp. TaxID=2767075 RepID=UPI0026283B61|nr:hypothetical protein [Trebonia sp.]